MLRAQQASVLGAYIGSCVARGAPARSGERRRDAQRPRPGYFSRNQRRRALCIYYYYVHFSIFAPPRRGLAVARLFDFDALTLTLVP